MEIFNSISYVTLTIIGLAIVYFQIKIQKSQRDIQEAQLRSQELQLRIGLFDKRYEVFHATMVFITIIMQNVNLTLEDLMKFLRDSKYKEFLFDSDIREYLDELYNQGLKLKRIVAMADKYRSDNKHEEYANEIFEITGYFQKQFEVASIKFGEYLKIDNKFSA